MQLRSLTRLRVSVALSFAVLAIPAVASALVAVPFNDRWTFDEEDGAIAYDDTGVYHGTLGASATRSAGPFGSNVLTLVPTDIYDTEAYVELDPSAGNFGIVDFSITHWYRTTFSGSGIHGDILGNRVDGSLGNYFSVRLRGDGTVAVELCEDEEGAHYVDLTGDPSYGVNDGQWHHLAYVRSGPTVSLYIDGMLADTRDSASGHPASIAGNAPFRIGRSLPPYYDNFHTIPASYEDVRLFDRALDENEILDLVDGTL